MSENASWRLVADLSTYDTATLRDAERHLRFLSVGHGSEFRTRQLRNHLEDIQHELSNRWD